MEKDKDAICELMERGLRGFDEGDDYDRAEALWGAWCDPERVACPECDGRGWHYEDWWTDDDFGSYEVPCETCYGTGKVAPPTPPPPPPPPKPTYRIVNAGFKDRLYRVMILDEGQSPGIIIASPTSYEEARKSAADYIHLRLGGR